MSSSTVLSNWKPGTICPHGARASLHRHGSSREGPFSRRLRSAWLIAPGVETEETWRPTPAYVGFIDVSLDPAGIGGVEEVRIFSGYAGWGAGQLEMELDTGSWFPVEGSVDDVFDPVPTTLWRRVLLRQDRHVARYANYPIDPRSN